MNAKDKISVIVPCYNEAEVLMDFYHTAKSVLTEKVYNADYEILFIDDGSKDATSEIIEKLSDEDEHVKFLIFSRNFGKESAMYAGLQYASGNYMVIIDADLQHPPQVIAEMYQEIKSGKYDMIATRRKNRNTDTRIRAFFSEMFYKFMNIMSGINMGNNAMDFRMLNKKATDAILSMTEYNRFSKGIFEWIGFRTRWLEIEIADRKAGKSKWSLRKLFAYSLEGCIAFSTLPLSLASIVGFLFCVTALIMIVLMIIEALTKGIAGTGYATIVCIILMVGGIQLFCIGILGQYIAKTYLESKRRPMFLIQNCNIENIQRKNSIETKEIF